MERMEAWNKLKKPPISALKEIRGGRLKGKTDINPQWRYQAMTEVFGQCGIGWKYVVEKKWIEDGPDGQVFCFADINLYYLRDDGNWSDPIPGSGGSMLVELESNGLHANDEAFKMAITDALSVAMKMIGMASEVYLGNWDGSKYKDEPEPVKKSAPPPSQMPDMPDTPDTVASLKTKLNQLMKGYTPAEKVEFFKYVIEADVTLEKLKKFADKYEDYKIMFDKYLAEKKAVKEAEDKGEDNAGKP